MTTLSYDERSKWDRYALTMPISRSDLVFSKYMMGIVLSFIAFVLNFIFQRTAGTADFTEALLVSAATMGVGLFFLFVILPVQFKFGVEKGRYIIMLILFVPTGVIMFMQKAGLTLPGEAFMQLLPTISILFIILAGVISARISLTIYKRKGL
jgi:hypothetical protein